MVDSNNGAVKLLSDDEVAEIEARATKATKAPWTSELRNWPIGDTGDYDPIADVLAVHGDIDKPRPIALFHELTTDENAQGANCEFTAHAREDIPALCATVRALRDGLSKLRQQVEDTIVVAQTEEDADGFVSAYHFKTGAIHRLLAEARKGG